GDLHHGRRFRIGESGGRRWRRRSAYRATAGRAAPAGTIAIILHAVHIKPRGTVTGPHGTRSCRSRHQGGRISDSIARIKASRPASRRAYNKTWAERNPRDEY